MNNNTLREKLQDWTPFTVAAFYFGQHINVLPEGSWDEVIKKEKREDMFEGYNPIGNMLKEIVFSMIRNGFLEEVPNKVKWKKGL